MTSPPGSNGSPKPNFLKNNPKLLGGVALALGLVLVFAFFSHQGFFQFYRIQKEKAHLDQEIARLTAENDRLARTIDRLQHDPEMVQDLIRRELNFVKKNEIIFQLPPETGALNPAKPGSPGKAAPKASGERPLPGAGPRDNASAAPGETAASPKPPKNNSTR